MSCSFHSYQPALTRIDIPVYRQPDSLSMVKEGFTVAGIVWHDYYTDPQLAPLIDSALVRNSYPAILVVADSKSGKLL